MKALFFYSFGVISTLYVFMVLFNLYASEIIDEYWLDYIFTNYANTWYYGSLTILSILILFIIIFVYNLGKGVSDKKEPLLFNKEENQYE